MPHYTNGHQCQQLQRTTRVTNNRSTWRGIHQRLVASHNTARTTRQGPVPPASGRRDACGVASGWVDFSARPDVGVSVRNWRNMNISWSNPAGQSLEIADRNRPVSTQTHQDIRRRTGDARIQTHPVDRPYLTYSTIVDIWKIRSRLFLGRRSQGKF